MQRRGGECAAAAAAARWPRVACGGGAGVLVTLPRGVRRVQLDPPSLLCADAARSRAAELVSPPRFEAADGPFPPVLVCDAVSCAAFGRLHVRSEGAQDAPAAVAAAGAPAPWRYLVVKPDRAEALGVLTTLAGWERAGSVRRVGRLAAGAASGGAAGALPGASSALHSRQRITFLSLHCFLSQSRQPVAGKLQYGPDHSPWRT